jgi:hypothetical protein
MNMSNEERQTASIVSRAMSEVHHGEIVERVTLKWLAQFVGK